MNNPFVFGETVSGKSFCDRETEHAALCRDLKDSQKLFFISPRRYGKTSLLKKVLSSLDGEDVITVYIDLYRASSLQAFLELYCTQVAQAAETAIDKALGFVREVLPRLRPTISIDADGRPSLGIEPLPGKKELSKAMEEAFEFPAHVAEKKNKRVVVIFDEFQEIAQFDGEALEKTMRAHIQHHRSVGYVFSGSKRHMLEDMTLNNERAFYKIGKIMYLQKIPRTIFAAFLTEIFVRGGFTLEPGVVERVLDITEDIPYNAQFMCHELWDRYRDEQRITTACVDQVLSTLLEEQTPFFIVQWDALSLNQRGVLRAIARHGGANVFSQDFLQQSGITSLPTLQTSFKLLVKKGIVEKHDAAHAIADIFFREWIKQKI